MIEGKRILITGGAGFIGSHLVERLVLANKITIFDNFSRNALSADLLQRERGIDVVQGDILDHDDLTRATSTADIVIHCAAIAGIDTVGTRPVDTLRVNVLGSLNVLEAAVRSASLDRVVCFSTSEVYGRRANPASEEADSHIGPPGEPRWTYAAGKVVDEHLALAFHHQYGLPTVVVRPFNVYGPRQVGEGAIRNFLSMALSGSPLEIRGKGDAVRAWTYVTDMVEGVCLASAMPEAIGQHFNVGNPNEPVTVRELAERVKLLTGSKSEIVHVASQGVDVAERVPDISKAERTLAFRPLVTLDEGILATARFIRDHS